MGTLSRFIKFLGIFGVICTLLIAVLPTVVSSDWGRQYLVEWINYTIPGKIQIRHLDLNWKSGQVLEGVTLTDPEGQPVLEIEKLSIEAPLLQLLKQRTHLGYTVVQQLSARIITDEEGKTNLQRALGQANDQRNVTSIPSTIALSHVHAELYLFAKDHPLSAKIDGITLQDNAEGSFQIDFTFNNLPTLDWNHFKEQTQNYMSIEGSKDIEVEAKILNFPVDLIDRLVALKNPFLNGFFRSIIGDKLNITLSKDSSKKELDEEEFSFHLTASSPLLKSDVKGKIDGTGMLSLQEPASLSLQLSPKSLNPFVHSHFELLQSSQIKLVCSQFSMPLNFFDKEDCIDPSCFTMQAELLLAKTEVDLPSHGKMSIPNSPFQIQVSIHPNHNKDWNADFSLNSPYLDINKGKFQIGKNITLTSPIQMDWMVSPNLLQHLLKKEELKFDQPVALRIILKQLQVSLEKGHSLEYEVEASVPMLQFSHLSPIATLQLQDILFNVKGRDLEGFDTKLNGQIALQDPEKSPFIPLPDPIQLNQSSSWKIISGSPEMVSGQLKLENRFTNLQLTSHLSSDLHLELLKPIQLQYRLTPQALEYLAQLLDKQCPSLQKDSQIKLKIEPTNVNLKDFFSTLKIQGVLDIDQLTFEDSSKSASTLDKLNLFWVFDVPMNNCYANIKGFVSNHKNTKPTPLSAYLQFSPDSSSGRYDMAQNQTEFRLNCAGLPISILNIPYPSVDLAPIFGPILDVNIRTFFDPTNQKPGYWDILLDSSQFHLQGRFKHDKAITLLDHSVPAEFRLSMTPENYEYLKKLFSLRDNHPLTLPVTLTCSLTDLYLPFSESWLSQLKVDLKFYSSDIVWKDLPKHPIKFEGQFTAQELSDKVNFSLKAYSSLSNTTFQGTLGNLLDIHGHPCGWEDINFTSTIQGTQLNPLFIQNLFLLNQDQTEKIQTLFGDSIDINMRCQIQQLNGPVQAYVNGTNGQLKLDAQLKQGILTLQQPLESSITMTPLFNKKFLSPIFHLLHTAIESDEPIKFTIDPSEFSFSLFPYKPESLVIGRGMLDFGKLHFRNEGELHQLLSFIQPTSGSYLTIWFTPLYFQVKSENITFHRLDMFINQSYTLAFWGAKDLKNEESQFTIGLTAPTLQSAFGIQGLDESYIMPIPLTISKGKTGFNKKALTAKITSLIAQMQGKKVKILGDLIDLAFSDTADAYPAPTTKPFPWEGEFVDASSPEDISQETHLSDAKNPEEKNEGKKKHHHRKDKGKEKDLGKEIGKGAIQLLDQFLGP